MADVVKIAGDKSTAGKTVRRRRDRSSHSSPTKAQRLYLARGLDQPGGKLPLFDENGSKFNPRTIKACVDNGWAEPWFENPQKPDWQVCKLTARGAEALKAQDSGH